jgi:hypothetical protein
MRNYGHNFTRRINKRKEKVQEKARRARYPTMKPISPAYHYSIAPCAAVHPSATGVQWVQYLSRAGCVGGYALTTMISHAVIPRYCEAWGATPLYTVCHYRFLQQYHFVHPQHRTVSSRASVITSASSTTSAPPAANYLIGGIAGQCRCYCNSPLLTDHNTRGQSHYVRAHGAASGYGSGQLGIRWYRVLPSARRSGGSLH